LLTEAKKAIRERLISRGVWTEKSTPIADVAALITDLRPVKNSMGLQRFGPLGDGGYLMPDDLDGVVACISPGVSTEAGFDREIAERGIDVYLADASISRIPIFHKRFHFLQKFFDAYNSENTIMIDDYCSAVSGDGDLILQMDIEGAEYRVLTSASDNLLHRFRIMVIEFHDMGHLFSRAAFREMSSVFRKLRRTHEVVHIHPNNVATSLKIGALDIPLLLEFTFYRKDRDSFEQGTAQFPHPLDFDNVPGNASLVLPRCWRPQGS
jgi:hypothetical protein